MDTVVTPSACSSSPSPSPSLPSYPLYRLRYHRLLRWGGDAVDVLLPGAAQGIATVLLGHPFDTAKTRMQAAGPNAGRSSVFTMAQMARKEGVRSLYRGATPPLVMQATKRSLQFALWDFIRHRGGSSSTTATTTASARSDTALRSMVSCTVDAVRNSTYLSGALAGGMGTIIGCPMHVIKIQTQNQTAAGTRNAWTCARSIATTEGIGGFYRGFRYHLMKDVCFAGLYLGLYAHLKEGGLRPRPNAAGSPDVPPILRSPRASAFLSGAVACLATWTVLYPLDTVKTVVQARQTQLLAWANLRNAPRTLYRGLAASLVKAGPVAGVSMVVYDSVWQHAEKRRERREWCTDFQ